MGLTIGGGCPAALFPFAGRIISDVAVEHQARVQIPSDGGGAPHGPDYLACGDCGTQLRVNTRAIAEQSRLYGAHGGVLVRCARCEYERFPRGRGGCDMCGRRDPRCENCAGRPVVADEWNDGAALRSLGSPTRADGGAQDQ